MQIALISQANILELPLVAKASGNAITAGTVNFYLVDKDGDNAGKWYRGSDTSWQAAEAIAGAATHRVNGHWWLSFPSAVWARDIRYRLYAKEDGGLHITVGEDILGGVTTSAIQDLIEADKVIDTSGDPWVLEWRQKTTKTVLLRQEMQNTGGTNITSTNNVLGQLELE